MLRSCLTRVVLNDSTQLAQIFFQDEGSGGGRQGAREAGLMLMTMMREIMKTMMRKNNENGDVARDPDHTRRGAAADEPEPRFTRVEPPSSLRSPMDARNALLSLSLRSPANGEFQAK